MPSDIKPVVVAAIKPRPKNLSRRVAVVDSLDEAVALANELDSDVCPFVGVGAAEAFWRTKATAEHPGRHICLWGEAGTGRTHLARCFNHFAGRHKMVLWDCVDGPPQEFAPTTILKNAGAMTLDDWQILPLDGEFRIAAISHEPSPSPDWFENIRVPPLRERLADLDALGVAILQRLTRRQTPPEIGVQVRHRLLIHPWPGNIAELETVLNLSLQNMKERTGGDRKVIQLDDLPPMFAADVGVQTTRGAIVSQNFLFTVFRRGMAHADWDLGEAADRFGLSVPTLQAVIQELRLDRQIGEDGQLAPAEDEQRKVKRN